MEEEIIKESLNEFYASTRDRGRTRLSEILHTALQKQKGEIRGKVDKISWDFGCNCNMCYAHEKARNSILQIIDNV